MYVGCFVVVGGWWSVFAVRFSDVIAIPNLLISHEYPRLMPRGSSRHQHYQQRDLGVESEVRTVDDDDTPPTTSQSIQDRLRELQNLQHQALFQCASPFYFFYCESLVASSLDQTRQSIHSSSKWRPFS